VATAPEHQEVGLTVIATDARESLLAGLQRRQHPLSITVVASELQVVLSKPMSNRRWTPVEFRRHLSHSGSAGD